MSSSTSPALPPFSYAQAARGLTPSNQVAPKSPEPNVVPTEENTRETKSATTEPGKLDLTSSLANSKVEKSRLSSPGSEVAVDQHQAALDNGVVNKENIPLHNSAGSSAEDSKPAAAAPVSLRPAGEASAQLPKSESSSLPQNDASDSWDKQSEVSVYAEKSTQTAEKAKGKDSEDDWEKVSAPAVLVEKELRPAPIPTVNFWLQRKAEQAAKTKESVPQQRPAVATSTAPTNKPKTQATGSLDEAKRKPSDKTQSSIDKDGNGSRRKQEASRPIEGGRRLVIPSFRRPC